jgi:hypothetical protein
MGTFFMSTQSHIDKVNLKPNLMTYPAHVAAPKIEPIDLTTFKRAATQKVNKVFDKRYKELMEEAETLQKSFQITQEVYSSKYRFEPIVGEIYHLYEDSNGTKTLSIINPTEWNKKYLYSVILNSDMTWDEIKIHI